MTTQMHPVQLQYSHTIGRAEFSGPGFRAPVGIARGEDDQLYVLSRSYEARPDGKRITLCTVGEDYVTEFGRGLSAAQAEAGAVDGAFMWPTALALDSAGNVYVSDEWFNRISIFTKDGDWVGKWGTPGDGDGELNRPSGLALDQDDNVYVVDSLNHRIQKFSKEGAFLAKWGAAGSGEGEFNMPWGIAIDTEGDVYVSDWRNDRIQKFTASGQFLMSFGASGTGEGEFNRPTGIAVDQDGVIYVADWRNERLQVFNADGSFVMQLAGEATVSKWGKEKLDANAEMWQQRARAQGLEREKQFWGPIAVAVDAENRIFVAETARSRIQVYRKQVPIFIGDRL
ncbi:MAG: 6-bladed beta-propeller [Candidatus Tectomicrobia bacterium]|nr:6-bladed beta-propeller [Candidatus Tectomicrobia bacterium]